MITTQKIVRYAVSICEDYRDDCAEVDLTHLGEAVCDHFDLTDDQYEDNDVSFLIFKELERLNLL